jgi:DNA-binding MarR family transcriptional regulator
MDNFSYELSEKQITILNLLMEKNYIQKDLQSKLNLSSPGLLYHLNKLEKLNFIEKKTIQQIGNAKINEISLDPIQLQNIRRKLNLKADNCTLITGFGELKTGYKIPDETFKILHNKHYIIDKVVCITTKKGKMIRERKAKEEKLIEIDRFYSDFVYNDFRDINSTFFQELDNILRAELKESNLVIDITPLSKLYSFEMLKRANKYQLPCYYLGKDQNENDSLIWMTNIQLTGEYKK